MNRYQHIQKKKIPNPAIYHSFKLLFIYFTYFILFFIFNFINLFILFLFSILFILSIYLFIYLFIFFFILLLFIYLYIFIYLFNYSSILSIYLFIYFIYLFFIFFYLFIYLFILFIYYFFFFGGGDFSVCVKMFYSLEEALGSMTFFIGLMWGTCSSKVCSLSNDMIQSNNRYEILKVLWVSEGDKHGKNVDRLRFRICIYCRKYAYIR